jgi:hypothetical protein
VHGCQSNLRHILDGLHLSRKRWASSHINIYPGFFFACNDSISSAIDSCHNSCSIGVDDNASLSVGESLFVILIYVLESFCVPGAQNDRGLLQVRLQPGKRSNIFVVPEASSLMGVPSSASESGASSSTSSAIGSTKFSGPQSLE